MDPECSWMRFVAILQMMLFWQVWRCLIFQRTPSIYVKDYLTGRRAQHLLREARLPHAAGAPHLRGQDARHGRVGRALRQAVLLLRHWPQVTLIYAWKVVTCISDQWKCHVWHLQVQALGDAVLGVYLHRLLGARSQPQVRPGGALLAHRYVSHSGFERNLHRIRNSSLQSTPRWPRGSPWTWRSPASASPPPWRSASGATAKRKVRSNDLKEGQGLTNIVKQASQTQWGQILLGHHALPSLSLPLFRKCLIS